MPSKQVLSEKQQLVEDLTQKMKTAPSGVIVDYKGINVKDDTALRKEFREAGVHYTVVKNTMLRFAAEKAGLSGFEAQLEGTTALALATEDAMAPARIAAKYADSIKNAFEIKAGFMDGDVMDAAQTTAVGKLPSREILLGQLLSVLTGNVRGLACALNKIAEQKESA